MMQLADTSQLTPEARRLIEDNLPLVDHITRRVTASFPRHVERDELARAGMLGLVEAAARFDPSRGRFAAFAGRRIEGAILDEVRRRSWAPRSVRSRARSLGQLEEALTHQLGHPPGDARLAEAAGLSLEELAEHRVRSARGWVDTLDRPAGDDAGPSLAELVADPHSRPAEELVEEDELRTYLRSAVLNLPERHRVVIVGYFMEGRPMEELARLLGVSQSRVSQLKDYALALMRAGIESQYRESPDVAATGGRSERTRAAYAALVADHAAVGPRPSRAAAPAGTRVDRPARRRQPVRA